MHENHDDRSHGGVSIEVLRRLPEWSTACKNLDALHGAHGPSAEQHAQEYGSVYEERRAAMVFDVVYSRMRRYEQRVLPQVEAFEALPGSRSLEHLRDHGTSELGGLRKKEAKTMQEVAEGLLRYGRSAGLNGDDVICRRWAQHSDVGVLYGLDQFVGGIRGIGIALFHYLRMRAGADTLKPDRRVGEAMRGLGFPVSPNWSESVYVMGLGAAAELGIRPLVLDQLLWWSGT